MNEPWEGEVEPEFDPDLSPGESSVDDKARQAGDNAVAVLAKITAQMAGGEHRPEQEEMCRAVAEAIVERRHLVVQAGTGTGKSLAYLVPLAALGVKTVVATATNTRPDSCPPSRVGGVIKVETAPQGCDLTLQPSSTR